MLPFQPNCKRQRERDEERTAEYVEEQKPRQMDTGEEQRLDGGRGGAGVDGAESV